MNEMDFEAVILAGGGQAAAHTAVCDDQIGEVNLYAIVGIDGAEKAVRHFTAAARHRTQGECI